MKRRMFEGRPGQWYWSAAAHRRWVIATWTITVAAGLYSGIRTLDGKGPPSAELVLFSMGFFLVGGAAGIAFLFVWGFTTESAQWWDWYLRRREVRAAGLATAMNSSSHSVEAHPTTHLEHHTNYPWAAHRLAGAGEQSQPRPTVTAADVARRLTVLDELHDNNRITDNEWLVKRAEILRSL